MQGIERGPRRQGDIPQEVACQGVRLSGLGPDGHAVQGRQATAHRLGVAGPTFQEYQRRDPQFVVGTLVPPVSGHLLLSSPHQIAARPRRQVAREVVSMYTVGPMKGDHTLGSPGSTTAGFSSPDPGIGDRFEGMTAGSRSGDIGLMERLAPSTIPQRV